MPGANHGCGVPKLLGTGIGTGDVGRRPSRSPSPGHRPGEQVDCVNLSAQRANPSANAWPVGPVLPVRLGQISQGDALGWVNNAPSERAKNCQGVLSDPTAVRARMA